MSPIIEAMKPSPNSDRQSCASLGELFPKNGTAFATESPTTFVSSRPTIFGSSRRPGIYSREFSREFFEKGLRGAILASKTRAGSIAYGRIPCSTEQGIFLLEQGIFSREQGNFARGWIPPFALGTMCVSRSTLTGFVLHRDFDQRPAWVTMNTRW